MKESKREVFRFWVTADQPELIKFLKSKTETTEGFSEYARKMFELIRVNKLELDTLESMKKNKMQIDIEFKKVMTDIKKIELLWMKESGNTPSYAAKKAIKTRASNEIYGEHGFLGEKTHTPPEDLKKELDIQKTQDFILTHFGKFIRMRKLDKDGWKILCSLCETTFIQIPTILEADERLKKHLFETHKEEIWENV